MNISLPNITAPSAGEARKTGSLILPATARDGPAIATGMPDFGLAYDKSAEPLPGSAPAQEPEPETGMTGAGQRPAKHAGGAEPEDLDASFMDGPHDDAEEISSPHLSEGASHPAATGAAMPKPQAVRNPEITRDQIAVDDRQVTRFPRFTTAPHPKRIHNLSASLRRDRTIPCSGSNRKKAFPTLRMKAQTLGRPQLHWLAKRPGNMQWGETRRNPHSRPRAKARSSSQPNGRVLRGTAGRKLM
ncbi:hypothetical protein ACFQFQ_00070 [Sulfitobacter porphyrae]|uniref:Uncharacterized protein n=1 Tax=Sulfitobacter porphyrae TaxID=1246864 RepID=A0ABW2AY42_9RHOB